MEKRVGLGDIAAKIAKPAAKAIDAVFKTAVSLCAGCNDRRDWLNNAVPDVLHPFRRDDADASL